MQPQDELLLSLQLHSQTATPLSEALHCEVCSNPELGPEFCQFLTLPLEVVK